MGWIRISSLSITAYNTEQLQVKMRLFALQKLSPLLTGQVVAKTLDQTTQY